MQQPNIPFIIIKNIKKLKDTYTIQEDGSRGDGFLMGVLREYNLHNTFMPIFENHKEDVKTAIVKVAFTILSYTYNSSWLNIAVDRYINKLQILTSLVKDSEIDIAKDTFDSILRNEDTLLQECASMYISSQRNGDFQTLIALTEHKSFANKMAMTANSDTTDIMLKNRTEYLNRMPDIQRAIEKIEDNLRTKYMILDEALRKEGMTPITDNLDFTDYETRLRFIVENGLFDKKETTL